MRENKHEFALFFEEIENFDISKKIIKLTDLDLIHRISIVLRLKNKESFILFNRVISLKLELIVISKKILEAEILAIFENKKLKPEIIFLLPLLKTEALEKSIYYLSELGVSTIQLIESERSRKSIEFSDKYLLRLEKIIIAAAEQSKNFYFPNICAPLKLAQYFDCNLAIDSLKNSYAKFLFDLDGESFQKKLFCDLKKIILVCGPEAGLSEFERMLLVKNNFKSLVLTTTVLRASSAVLLGTGIFRLKN